MNGVELIAAERRRQIEVEGWTAEHDDLHVEGELASAAACYAMPPTPEHDNMPTIWPWSPEWWKPGDGSVEGRKRELAKAGAMVAAELDRLSRMDGSASVVTMRPDEPSGDRFLEFVGGVADGGPGDPLNAAHRTRAARFESAVRETIRDEMGGLKLEFELRPLHASGEDCTFEMREIPGGGEGAFCVTHGMFHDSSRWP